jgi:hypothetical protein
MALGESSQVVGLDFGNASLIDFSGGNVPRLDKFPQPGRREGLVFVVVDHRIKLIS